MSSSFAPGDRRRNPSLRESVARRAQELEAVNAELRARTRQQVALAALGQRAIRDHDLAGLLDEAAAVTAATLDADFTAIGQRVLGTQSFILRSGQGWKPGIVGQTSSSVGTPVEYMLRTVEPLVVADLRHESRFSAPPTLLAHGVVSALYAPIRGHEAPWGNLSAYCTRERVFTPDEIGFLQSIANVLALAVERQDLEIAKEREREILQAIFDNIPVMISFFAPDGTLLRANREWEETLGWSLEEARRIDILSAAYPDPEERRRATEFIGRSERRWGDFRTQTRDGRMLDTSWARFELSDGYRVGFGLNLTERKRAERALAASEARFAMLFQASPVALAMTEVPSGRIFAVNRSWLELLGFSAAEVQGRTNTELGLSVDGEVRDLAIESMLREGALRNFEMRLRRRDGAVREVIISSVMVEFGDDAQYALSAITDISDRKRVESERDRLTEETRAAHERLESLSRRLLTAQEEERHRLAVELHDELGQVLTAVKINLESFARAAASPAPTGTLDEAIGSVDLALRRVRDLALDLRPSVLDDLGLPPALRWYVDRFARASGIEVTVSIDAVPDLEPEIATACFRVAQEALTNVLRHAGARRVWLELQLGADALELVVRDDGRGFDAVEARRRASLGASLGLLGMQERVTLSGGEFALRTPAGGGTEVLARFPLRVSRRRPA